MITQAPPKGCDPSASVRKIQRRLIVIAVRIGCRSTAGVRHFMGANRQKTQKTNESRAASGLPRIVRRRQPIAPAALTSVCAAARVADFPGELFQQHFKGLTFNARQALAVKFER